MIQIFLQAKLGEVANLTNFANDESDFGMGLKLGLDMFAHSARFRPHACSLLGVAYSLLKDAVFVRVLQRIEAALV